MTSKKRRFLAALERWKRTIRGERSAKKPARLTEQQETATTIFLRVLHRPETKLYYDITTSECFLRYEPANIYLFLEPGNLKIINSVYGYDVSITSELDYYLSERFRKEMNIRRAAFKTEALSKVKHSLNSTLNSL